MKNFKKQIKKTSFYIQQKFKSDKQIFLFGFNKITSYLLKKNISNICVVDKEYIDDILQLNQESEINLITIDEVPSCSIFVNCITGVYAGEVNAKLRDMGHEIFSWIEIKNALNFRDFNYWYLVNFDIFFFKNTEKFKNIFKNLSDFESKKQFLKIISLTFFPLR